MVEWVKDEKTIADSSHCTRQEGKHIPNHRLEVSIRLSFSLMLHYRFPITGKTHDLHQPIEVVAVPSDKTPWNDLRHVELSIVFLQQTIFLAPSC